MAMQTPPIDGTTLKKPEPRLILLLQRLWADYTVRTLFQSVITIWAVITFIFFLVRLMTGNTVEVYID